MGDILLEMKNITKRFPGVKALDNVNFKVKAGEIHALCGENGAGKSTLVKILSGVYPYGSYTGDIQFNGRPCAFRDIKQSEQAGIVIIHQELSLIPELTIAENIFLGNERATKGVIDWIETTSQTKKLLKKVNLSDPPDTLIKQIGVGKQQLVEIAKALAKEVKLLILDEPTAALNEKDSENLLNLLLEFKRQGITSVMISHKLDEVLAIADSVTVLRDGETVETLERGCDRITEDRIIRAMVGRSLTNRYPPRTPRIGETVFEVTNWTVYHPLQSDRKVVDNVSLRIRNGEIVGIAGLMGAGRTELAMSLFGKSYGQKIAGTIKKDGIPVEMDNVSQAIKHGVVYVTEDRKTYGLILMNDIKTNITLPNLKYISKNTVVNEQAEVTKADHFRRKLGIKSSSLLQKTEQLSGGNQQKVVLSKWMMAEPDILILDEPTRGIDVGAKYEIYAIMNQLAESGKGILLISSELPEILGMCDRIYTMSEGKITGELNREEATQEKLMAYMTNTREGQS
jgi:putative multiple sugar transport system ATP-binding protein